MEIMSKQYYVYILTNDKNVLLYVGITNNLVRRVFEHKNNLVKGFTQKHCIHKLVYFEEITNVMEAILREKRIKKWNRSWKERLINKQNSSWRDLYTDILT